MSYYGPPGGAPPPPQGYYQQAPPYQQPPPGQFPGAPYGGGQYGAPPPPHGGHYPPQSGYPPPGGQGYGVPPPQQYPPQPHGHGGYGQPPPPNNHPPPAGQPPYGAPSPHYGAQGSYGAPPPGPSGYAPPALQQYGPPTAPSPGYGPPQIIQWDGTPDAQALRAAMKGFGTDEKTLVRVLADKPPLYIDAIKSAFNRSFNRNLEKDIISETRSWFQKGLCAIVQGPLLHDCHRLYEAISGPGTKEVVLNDVLLGKSNADMHAIKGKYQQVFGRSLENDVKGDLSMKTERHFMIVLGASRAEDSVPVTPDQVERDVMDLYRATEGKVGTDEMMVCSILSTRNDNQIRAITASYEQKFRRRLEDVIRKEFSGHMEDALLFQLRNAVDKYMHAAQLLEDSMAGMGTKDHLLVSRVVRFHWDSHFMANVKGAYQSKYRTPLASRIRGETSGDYQRLMLACTGERV